MALRGTLNSLDKLNNADIFYGLTYTLGMRP